MALVATGPGSGEVSVTIQQATATARVTWTSLVCSRRTQTTIRRRAQPSLGVQSTRHFTSIWGGMFLGEILRRAAFCRTTRGMRWRILSRLVLARVRGDPRVTAQLAERCASSIELGAQAAP